MFTVQMPGSKLINSEKNHRISDILQQIKELTNKKKYNQAWQQAAKFYEQNKSSLNNYEIYQLCWESCITIRKKLMSRLIESSKIPVTSAHMEHFFSLYTTLHNITLPEIIKWDKPYFSMLGNSEEVIHSQFLSQNNIFQRKIEPSFLLKHQVQKELKKLVKKHLKVCQVTLMYYALGEKNIESLVKNIKEMQQIFKCYKEIDFPSQIMNFQLIKLSIFEDLGIRQPLCCEYRLPVGYLNKIYKHLKTGTQAEVNHYIKKLISYLVLCFKHLTISVEDAYILCNQMLYLIKTIQQQLEPGSEELIQIQKQSPHSLFQGYAGDKDEVDQSLPSMKLDKKCSSQTTGTKISEKRVQSKKIIEKKPHQRLKRLVNMALDKMEDYIASRKEIKHILLSYCTESFIKNRKNSINDQIIETEVRLQNQRKNKKNSSSTENGEIPMKTTEVHKSKTLTALFRKNRQDKRNLGQESTQSEHLMMIRVSNKNRGKFILKNIEMVNKKASSHINQTKPLHDSLSLDEISVIEESSSDSDGEVEHQFQKIRRKRIRDLNSRKMVNSNEYSTNKKILSKQNGGDQDQPSNQLNKDQMYPIKLLDEIVTAMIYQMLGLKSTPNTTNHHNMKQGLSKLQNLRIQAQTLNLERRLLVEQLLMSKNRSKNELERSGLSVNDQLIHMDRKSQEQHFTEIFNNKITKYFEENRKFMNIKDKTVCFKDKPSFMIKSNQPKIKLKLEPSRQKMSQITMHSLQEQYRAIQGTTDKKQQWDMCLSSQFDKLRRDVAKNQFAAQNQKPKKISRDKDKCKTILEMIDEEQVP